MREVLEAALVVVAIGGGLAVPLGLFLAKLAVSGPSKVLGDVFGALWRAPTHAVMQPAVMILGVGTPHGVWAETATMSRIYEMTTQTGVSASRPGLDLTSGGPAQFKLQVAA